MKVSLSVGCALIASVAVMNPTPAQAQLTKTPGQGAAIFNLVMVRNFNTLVDDGTATGLHPNEVIFAVRDVERVTANPRGQAVFVANESGDIRTKYFAGPGQTTFILAAPSGTEPLVEECLISDITGSVLTR